MTFGSVRSRWLDPRRFVPVGAVLAVILSAGAPPAEAKLFELNIKIHGGGMGGLQLADSVDPANTDPELAAVAGEDFFLRRRGAMFGGVVGVEIFFIDIMYEFYQFADANGLSSTLSNIFIGFDWHFPAGKRWLFEPYVVGGIGFATHNNSWLAKKYPQIALEDLDSRIAQVRVGLRIELKLGDYFRLGIDGGFGYHYGMQTATMSNDLDGHSHGFHFMGSLYLSFVWEPWRPEKKKPSKPLPPARPGGPSSANPGTSTPDPTSDDITRPRARPPVQEPPPAEPPRTTPPPERPRETPAPENRPAPSPSSP
jgi:hypothetical protein